MTVTTMSERWGGRWGGAWGAGEDSPNRSGPSLPNLNSENMTWGGNSEDQPKGSEEPHSGVAEGIASPPSPSSRDDHPSVDASPRVTAKKTRSGRHRQAEHRPDGRRRLVSLAAAAEYADVSTRTLRRYIGAGRLTGYRVGPRLLKVDLNEVEQLARPIPTARGTG